MPAGLAWLCLGLVALALDALTDYGDRRYLATLALGVLSVVFGLWVFWWDGGGRITAIGAYNFGFALLVGFAAVYQTVKTAVEAPQVPLLRAIALCYFIQVTTWLVFWTRRPVRPVPRYVHSDPALTGRMAVWGGVLLAVAVLLGFTAQSRHPLVQPAGFVGVVLLGVGLLSGRRRSRRLWYGLVPAAGFAVYVIYLFSGFGRIILGSLGLALAIILADRARGRRYVKSAVLAVLAPTIFLLGRARATAGDATAFDVDPDGMGSAVGPFHQFARLLGFDDFGMLPRGWGDTFLTAAVALVPRSVWPDKPVGFGAELVPYLTPELAGTGHSDAALFFGEWLFNFGPVGLLLMIPVTGLAVRGLDGLMNRMASRSTPAGLIGYVAVVLGVAGLIDLLWVGTFTYVARTGSRLLVVLVLLVIVVLWRKGLPQVPGAIGGVPDVNRRRRAQGPSWSVSSGGGERPVQVSSRTLTNRS
ncbi:hypothetical protein [Micromonospora halophytica]|uniref:hypothetical protein n=1 Tax=Micromonospora halophytica TaxID=47864 RepID=UPI001112E37F|nr:hypothetical protein [Micromonospora halophytica]